MHKMTDHVWFRIHHEDHELVGRIVRSLPSEPMGASVTRNGMDWHVGVPADKADDARAILRDAEQQHPGFTWQESPRP